MKKAELTVSALLVPLDFAMLFLAGLVAYAIRFSEKLEQIPPAVYTIPFQNYIGLLAITCAAWIAIFWWNKLYLIRGNRRIVDEVRKVFFACALGVLLIIVLIFFQRDLFSSRFIILTGFALATLFVSTARVIVILLERQLFKAGIGVQHMVVIGNGHIARVVKTEMEQKPTLGYKVLASFTEWSVDVQAQIRDLLKTNHIDELLLTDPAIAKEQSQAMVDFCDDEHITFKYAAAVFDTPFANFMTAFL